MEDKREPTQGQGEEVVPTPTAEELLGKLIKGLREARGVSQEQLAKSITFQSDGSIQWRQTTVAKTEAGLRPIRVNEAVELAKWFGIPPGDLIQVPGQESVDRDWLVRTLEMRAKALSRVAQAQADLEEAEADYERWEKEVESARKLLDSSVQASQEIDQNSRGQVSDGEG